MAGVAEKARFFLERSVPQLREWEEKELFSKEEIRTIVQKRNTHEHRVLSPGNKPSDWSAYAQWEQSLETLRRKRCNRLRIRHLNSAHAGQGRVLSIYDRAVNRHPNSATLWREYLSYTANIKAAKRFRRTMTDALRMMPHDTQLWVMAGRRSARSGDMAAARGFFMRGCRFCTQDGTLWIEYARCEMEWLKKVDQRKSKPGADPLRPDRPQGDDEIRIHDSDEEEDGDEEGDVLLPEPSKDEAKVIDKKAAKQLQNNPAMDGAIPMAIFDIARKQRFFNADSAEQFFVMFASFKDVSVQPQISRHVLDAMDQVYPNHPATCNVHIRQPILGVSPKTADFPRGLREVIPRLSKYLEVTTDRAELERKTARWIDEYLTVEDLDGGIRKVLEHTKGKLASI
ncbi:U3 small nucleolar RNA-associated protein-like protein [Hapsidospora chrysogenum ATCC 11550]|uniref:U3 small nucleolar RNA-associated protein-like protein n=1 Tax=Hapsidospora chrysogenum (strain ATCC 11550 / CBS 779.69 / DSM 880 / IAM 14645 / JCM 23072 / IMI 49137) TaxID=857340 RepID=A0A086TFS5_HAPC1|nr:U3 small nucleolar RNA-associated protein-like protein [Hapsidospora chrysogenum ATCC 11550]